MKNKDTLLDKCVREALRLGYSVHVQHFTAMAEEKYGSIEKYFEANPAPPPKKYSSLRPFEIVSLKDLRNRPIRRCRQCGKLVPLSSAYRYFDRAECYKKWDAERQRMRTREKSILLRPARPCPQCGKMLPAGTSGRKTYCSASCREKARYIRDKKGAGNR